MFFSSEGRIGRLRWWIGLALLWGIAIGATIISSTIISIVPEGAVPTALGAMFIIFFFGWIIVMMIGYVMLMIKRCHDRDHTGYYILMQWIPLIGLIFWLELAFASGSYFRNKYGEPPR
jgi:uncharacterized membrane protein YhaH (DUF805 family)